MMREGTENGMLEEFEISLEEFDEVNEYHSFSDKYKNKKKEALKMYRKKHLATTRHTGVKVAAAIAAFAIATPLAVNAATNGDLFNRLWGNAGKEDVESYTYEWDETWEDGTKHIAVDMPAIEYEDVAPEKAEELIGDNVLQQEAEYDIDGTKLTILSTVTDGRSMVVEYTLEREGGVDIYAYNQHSNETKGAGPSMSSNVLLNFGICDDKVFVDMDKSTEDKLYCYAYVHILSQDILDMYEEDGMPAMHAIILPCSNEEYTNSSPQEFEEIMAASVEKTIPLEFNDKVEMTEFVNEDGGLLKISPISMSFDMLTGLGIEYADPGYIYYVCINYKDGSSYLVDESNYSDWRTGEVLHSCDTEYANYYYCIGDGDDMFYIFNRLADVDNIESITVNETTYMLK